MHKNNSQNSSKFKGCSPLQLSCNLTGKKPAIGYFSYTKTLWLIKIVRDNGISTKVDDYYKKFLILNNRCI
jgi:hypothetical protein